MFKLGAILAFATLAVSQTTGLNGCQGVWVVNQQFQNGACCVGGTLSAPYLSTCAGWPICSGPATTTTTSEPLSCATVVVSDANYSSNLAVATSSLSASGTNFQTTLGEGSQGASASGTTPTAASSAASTTSSASSGAATSTTGSNGAANTMAGIGAVGGAFLLLAAWL